MLNSNERIDYINNYLSAYENKIKMANKQGLFDAAKMFELFALNICALWFGQPFKNLNTEVANYPYVDLISEDQRLFVQVSTVQDIAGKIKSTLEKIRDSKDSNFSSVENIVFFCCIIKTSIIFLISSAMLKLAIRHSLKRTILSPHKMF